MPEDEKYTRDKRILSVCAPTPSTNAPLGISRGNESTPCHVGVHRLISIKRQRAPSALGDQRKRPQRPLPCCGHPRQRGCCSARRLSGSARLELTVTPAELALRNIGNGQQSFGSQPEKRNFCTCSRSKTKPTPSTYAKTTNASHKSRQRTSFYRKELITAFLLESRELVARIMASEPPLSKYAPRMDGQRNSPPTWRTPLPERVFLRSQDGLSEPVLECHGTKNSPRESDGALWLFPCIDPSFRPTTRATNRRPNCLQAPP